MKHLIALLVLASLAIVGCSDKTSQEPVSALSNDTPLPLGKATPFKMRVSVVGFPTGTRCAPLLTVVSTGSGNATQLGRFTIVQSHCVNPATFAFTDGEATMTAANGDLLYGTYSGQLIPIAPPVFEILGRFSHAGGTGRFANATGEGVATGTLNFATGEAVLELDGWIERR